MTEIGLSSRARLIGGARFENDQLTLDASSTLGSPVHVTKDWKDVLPSLALNFQLNDAQQLRISGSRTLARPEYRELAPITSRDVLNGDDVARQRQSPAHEHHERRRRDGSGIRAAARSLSVGVFAKQFD